MVRKVRQRVAAAGEKTSERQIWNLKLGILWPGSLPLTDKNQQAVPICFGAYFAFSSGPRDGSGLAGPSAASIIRARKVEASVFWITSRSSLPGFLPINQFVSIGRLTSFQIFMRL